MFWNFVRSTVVPLMTVIAAIVVVIGNQFGLIPDSVLPGATLALIALLITSEIVDKNIKLNLIHNDLSELDKTVRREQGYTQTLLPNECYEGIKEAISKASKSILWVSPQNRRGTSDDARRVYESAIEKVVTEGKVRFAWVTRMDNKERKERKQRMESMARDRSKIVITEISDTFPGDMTFSFIIVDEDTLFTRAPFEKGIERRYVVTRDPHIVHMFIEYYEHIARNASG